MPLLKPAALSFFLLFAVQSSTSEARPDFGNDAIEAQTDLVEGEVIFLADGSSTCNCPQFKCGKVPQKACDSSCEPPSVAKCLCGNCSDYYRSNRCGCTE
jgi:hypothetical protein